MVAALRAAHVLAAVVFVGPVTVAASTFPRYVRVATAGGTHAAAAAASAAAMHRISRVYVVLEVAVPVLGVATRAVLDVLGQAWVVASTILTAAAGLLLALGVVPQQRRVLDLVGSADAAAAGAGRLLGRLAAAGQAGRGPARGRCLGGRPAPSGPRQRLTSARRATARGRGPRRRSPRATCRPGR